MVQLLNGISWGMLLFLLAAGLGLIYGLMDIVNLTHGSFYLLGAYIGITVFKATGSFLLSLFVGGVIIGGIGVVMERFFLRRFHLQFLPQVLLTLGFVYVFMDISSWVWKGAPMSVFPPAILAGSVNIGENLFPIYRLALILIGLAMAIALWLLLEKTPVGVIIRAGIDDKQMVTGLGINIGVFFTLVFALGAFLAGLGGVFGAPMLGAAPWMDAQILMLAFAVVVVGGLGTLEGALVGSLLIGITDSFVKTLFPSFATFTVAIAIAIVLTLKPSGLLGRR